MNSIFTEKAKQLIRENKEKELKFLSFYLGLMRALIGGFEEIQPNKEALHLGTLCRDVMELQLMFNSRDTCDSGYSELYDAHNSILHDIQWTAKDCNMEDFIDGIESAESIENIASIDSWMKTNIANGNNLVTFNLILALHGYEPKDDLFINMEQFDQIVSYSEDVAWAVFKAWKKFLEDENGVVSKTDVDTGFCSVCGEDAAAALMVSAEERYVCIIECKHCLCRTEGVAETRDEAKRIAVENWESMHNSQEDGE